MHPCASFSEVIMKYLLGVDFGGGASKATLLGVDGKVYATATYEYPTYYPAPGCAEQDPEDWYKATVANVRAVMEKSGAAPTDILALSLDAATHTAVLCDEEGRAVRPAIYWTDTRSVKEVKELRESHGSLIFEQALHNIDTIWTLPQILWVKNNEPELFAKTKRIMFAKDYVRQKITGDRVTDRIEAQGSMLYNCPQKKWSEELCALAGVREEQLPALADPTDIVGKVRAEAAADLGIAEGCPVLAGMTDTVAEVFAAGAVNKKNVTLKLATAGRICVITDKAHPSVHLVNYSHITNGLWYPGTATKSCAASLRWFRDTLGCMSYRELDEGAEKISVGCDGLMFHPYLNGELTPYADPALCGSFIGIRAGHTKAHFTRAVLEGVAMSLIDCKKALDGLNIPMDDYATAIGGGAASPLWRQIVSDALGIKLQLRNISDSSFGSAMLAGVAAGIFASPEDALAKCSEIKSETVPNPENTEKYEKLFEKYKAVHDALAPIYHG